MSCISFPTPKQIKIRTLASFAIMFVVVIADQLIKYAVKTSFSLYESVHVTPWFHLFFTENRGMAFGMQFVGTFALAIFRVMAIVFFMVVLWRCIRRRFPMGLIVCLSMIIAGALGNIIDNMFNGLVYTESLPYDAPAKLVAFGHGYGTFLSGKVIDMFYFPLFVWPDWMPLVGDDVFFGAVFNLADASISCGAVALAIFYFKYLNKGIFRNEKKVL